MRKHKTMSYVCNFCGKTQENSRTYPNGLCQGCYKYFHDGGTVNPIPKPGVIAHDYRGNVICHICGRAYKRLGSHIKESHDMTIKEYKERFGLCECSKTTERNYSKMMSDYAYKNNMPAQLQLSGFNTRIKVGETYMRKGKQTRLQETLDKRQRKIKKSKAVNNG